MSVESYKHNFAKNLLARWLRELAQEAGTDSYVNIPTERSWNGSKLAPGCLVSVQPEGIRWRVNRGGPQWGVWTEYPVNERGSELTCVWDENGAICRKTGLPYEDCGCHRPHWDDLPDGASNKAWATANDEHWRNHPQRWESAPPTYDQYVALCGKAPSLIFDVAVQHKGAICWVFEIVHKHAVSPAKADKYASFRYGSMYAVDADWILSQVGRPQRLVVEQVVGSAHAATA